MKSPARRTRQIPNESESWLFQHICGSPPQVTTSMASAGLYSVLGCCTSGIHCELRYDGSCVTEPWQFIIFKQSVSLANPNIQSHPLISFYLSSRRTCLLVNFEIRSGPSISIPQQPATANGHTIANRKGGSPDPAFPRPHIGLSSGPLSRGPRRTQISSRGRRDSLHRR